MLLVYPSFKIVQIIKTFRCFMGMVPYFPNISITSFVSTHTPYRKSTTQKISRNLYSTLVKGNIGSKFPIRRSERLSQDVKNTFMSSLNFETLLSKSQKQDPNVTERLSPNDPDLENRCEKLRYLGNFARTGRVPPIQLGKGKVHNPTLPFS